MHTKYLEVVITVQSTKTVACDVYKAVLARNRN